MKIEETSINSIVEIMELAKQGAVFKLYRGHGIANWKLTPSICRITDMYNKKISLLTLENEILKEFKRYSIPYLKSNTPTKIVDWYVLGQHYGLPTRLIDWTSNPLKALFFLCI